MKRMTAVVLCAGVAMLMAGVARAEGDATGKEPGKGRKHGDFLERFQKADANKDGKLSLDEFKTMSKKPDAEAEKMFKAADTDNDGFLTPAELKAARQKRAAQKHDNAAPPVPPAQPVEKK